MGKSNDKIVWLSIIQGWAILLVVIGHVNAFTYQADGEVYPFSLWVHRFCYSFHMPLFMFVSGGLLYLTRISRQWDTISLYKDKLRRLLLPYLLFTVIGFLVKIPFAAVSKRGMDISATGFLNALFDPANGPMGELWFIGTLMWLMFMYPVYKVMLTRWWSELLLLGMTLLPFLFDMHLDVEGWLNLRAVPAYALYFVAGILFFKYDGIRLFGSNLWLDLGVTALYAAAFLIEATPRFLVALLGILMSFAWAVRIAEIFPSTFSWFRDHSFQIFLVGLFPQMFVELIIWKRYHAEWMQLPFYLASCLLALACGVVVSKFASRLRPAWLRWFFGR